MHRKGAEEKNAERGLQLLQQFPRSGSKWLQSNGPGCKQRLETQFISEFPVELVPSLVYVCRKTFGVLCVVVFFGDISKTGNVS